MAPICKVGGLGDVVTALGRAVQELGHTVEVILPRYGTAGTHPLEAASMQPPMSPPSKSVMPMH
jgi:starch synthase